MEQSETEPEHEKHSGSRVFLPKLLLAIPIGLLVAWFLVEVILPLPYPNLAH